MRSHDHDCCMARKVKTSAIYVRDSRKSFKHIHCWCRGNLSVSKHEQGVAETTWSTWYESQRSSIWHPQWRQTSTEHCSWTSSDEWQRQMQLLARIIIKCESNLFIWKVFCSSRDIRQKCLAITGCPTCSTEVLRSTSPSRRRFCDIT